MERQKELKKMTSVQNFARFALCKMQDQDRN